MRLENRIALVTGSSRGIGRATARALGERGATVYVTGRTSHDGPNPRPGTIEAAAREVDAAGGRGIAVRCDHGNDDEVRGLFRRIEDREGRLDVLVNNAHSGLHDIAESLDRKFWELAPEIWDRMNHVGLRGHYVASVLAARMMTARDSGLIVNISSFGSLGYLFNAAYGIGKASIDRMTADFAAELKSTGVAVVSVWPGLVRTELTGALMERATPGYRRIFAAYGESPLVTGRAIAALAADPDVRRYSGRVSVAAEVARRHGLPDEHGEIPLSPRSLRRFARAALPDRWQAVARFAPAGRVPMWVVRRALLRFSEILKERGGFRGPHGGAT